MGAALVLLGVGPGHEGELRQLCWELSPEFPLPIVVAAAGDGEALRVLLQSLSPLPIKQVEDKDPILPRQIHIGPPDYHLLIEKGWLALDADRPEKGARPSCDALFASAAAAYADGAVGVLFGDGPDGTSGLEEIRRRGGRTLAQRGRPVSDVLAFLAEVAREAV
jgi:two-component system chemotaxis response regulator CheB